ncbi:hypothetical protein B0T22DRAFT_456022 [Podospora appendiculata]|uniref:TPR domain protein n=1 Tax=Podospora appendiculata TaxID=314037 RepID=A0AAE0XLJ8_9PEZI|nr:hypothetical protein B0T22DRAFT_456022 [Podospora appendiculata]
MALHPKHSKQEDEEAYFNLGVYSRPISTQSAAAKKWFDRGLMWNYGFNHEESVKCFERAAAADPACAIAYWGMAYSLGPNYNKPWGVFDEAERERIVAKANAALAHARHLARAPAAASPVERALVDALQHRYPHTHTPESQGLTLSQDYARAMEAVYRAHPADLDVMALYVDALMNLTPWALWDLRTGEPAENSRALEAKRILEQGLAAHPRHPGLIHLYIHLLEQSAHPERALLAADNLRGLVPDAGHLNHMPTHIDIIVGDYRRAIASNSAAVVADRKFVLREGPINFYSLYRCHNIHFRIYAAMFAGQLKVALESAEMLETTMPESLLRITSPPMADWLEGFLAMRVHILIRFGRWQEIIDLPLPADAELYCTTTAMTHYAKGVALAATGAIPAAEAQRDLFRAAATRVPSSRTIFNNTCVDLLPIASAMLDGELEYRRGNYELAFARLRAAIARDDALPYDEPWGWMQPTRHAYGALLLEQGRVEEAAAVYSADLGFDDTLPRALQHRNNVWALHGYYECLVKLGRAAEARIVKPLLELAVAGADVPIKASCFCRRGSRDYTTKM